MASAINTRLISPNVNHSFLMVMKGINMERKRSRTGSINVKTVATINRACTSLVFRYQMASP